MERKVIGMISGYSGLGQSDWLWKQTPHPFGCWGHIQMEANAPQPDFLLMYQFNFHKVAQQPPSWLNRIRHRKSNESDFDTETLLRGLPPERVIYLMREPPLPEVVHKHELTYERAQRYCGYVSGPEDFAPIPDYMPAIWYVNNSFRELAELPPPDKITSCSWITSGIDRTANHRQRLDFLKSLRRENIEFDLYGRNLPDWAGAAGELSNKWHGMAPYYYNLAIENYAENRWYVSEKLWDALLAWCLPIYHGGSAADALLPSGSFLRLPSLDEKGIAYIRDVTASPDAWYEAKEAIAEARQIILNKLNLLNWLSEFVGKLE